jgi:hypothetical protein
MSREDNAVLWTACSQSITNLLRNNADAGLAISLGFCYHEEYAIRELFISVFTNALNERVDLLSPTLQEMKLRRSYICEVRHVA